MRAEPYLLPRFCRLRVLADRRRRLYRFILCVLVSIQLLIVGRPPTGLPWQI
jgi:hypothetical protein